LEYFGSKPESLISAGVLAIGFAMSLWKINVKNNSDLDK